MENILTILNNELRTSKDFIDEEGNVIYEKVKASALNLDNTLFNILLGNNILKKAFFTENNNVLIFDKIKFSWIISNSDFLPDSFTSFKNKIGLVDDNGSFIKTKDDVLLSFPFKDCVLEFDSTSEEENRDEIFLNENLVASEIDTLLQPKAFSNPILHSDNGDKPINEYNGENLLIKGNNLIALHSLLPKYENGIQAMYWDILYNTDSDQVPYSDSFKHSSWLTMMKNRLSVGRKLLKKDGVIALQCDDHEMAYLKVLLDEIFGRDNKLSTVTIKVKAPAGVGQESFLFDVNEYILFYAKDINNCKVNVLKERNVLTENVYKQYHNLIKIKSNGEKIGTIVSERNGEMDLIKYDDFDISSISKNDLNETFYTENRDFIIRTTNPQGGFLKKIMPDIPKKGLYSITYKPSKGAKMDGTITYHFLNGSLIVWLSDSSEIVDGKIMKLGKMTNLWQDNFFQGISNEGSVTLNAGKKPEKLMQRIISLITNEGDTILDAFFGTGTTGAVAMKMNRKFIGIEQLDSHFEKAIMRITNVINGDTSGISKDTNWNGGGNFISCELAKNNLNLIEKIKSVHDDVKVNELYNELMSNPFILNYNIKIEEMKKLNMDDFLKLDLNSKKKVLIAILDKNMLYVNYEDIMDSDIKFNEEYIKFSNSFYRVGE